MNEIILNGFKELNYLFGGNSLYFIIIFLKISILSVLLNGFLYTIYNKISSNKSITFGNIFFNSYIGVMIIGSVLYGGLNILVWLFEVILLFFNENLYYEIFYFLEDYTLVFSTLINIYTLASISILVTWYLKLKKQI